MRIVVLVKQVPDTWGERRLDPATGRVERTGELVIDEVDERALEVALRHAEAAGGVEVVALAMGPATARDALRKALAMGADSAVHVLDDALEGSDMAATAVVLAAALTATGFDLVVAGNASTDGRGGVVPAMVAEHLGVPALTYLDSLEVTGGGVRGVRRTEYAELDLAAELPAVVSVTEAAPEARFPGFRGIMKAKKKPVQVLGLADLQLAAPSAAATSVLAATTRPARTAGTTVVDDGSGGRQLAEFLVSRRLL